MSCLKITRPRSQILTSVFLIGGLMVTVNLGTGCNRHWRTDVVQDVEWGRFARPEELLGAWKMVPFPHPERIQQVNPWPLPCQWFAFYPDQTMFVMMATDDYAVSEKDLAEMHGEMQGLPQTTYTWIETGSMRGFLRIKHPAEAGAQFWGVNLVTQRFKISGLRLLPGDLIMTLAGGPDFGPVYYRVLRRISAVKEAEYDEI